MRCCSVNALWGSRTSISFAPPLGLAYIAGVLEQSGHKVRVIDRVAEYYKDPDADLLTVDRLTEKEIVEFQPDMIGISATTVQFRDTQHLARLIRNLSGGGNYTIVAGGFHPSAEPDLTLKRCSEIDVVCRGEGEFTMLELCSGKELEEIQGLTFRKDDRVFSTENWPPIQDLDILPKPARHLLDMAFYHRRETSVNSGLPLRMSTMITFRGCPYSCKFCASRLIHFPVRFHSCEYVLSEFKSLTERYQIDAISFLDDMFLARRSRVEELCRALVQNRLNRMYKWTCSARASSVDENILRQMRKAGCIYIIYGFESGSQRMLDAMNKKTTVEQNYRAVVLTKKAGILINSAFIVNLPGEEEPDILATIEFIKRTKVYTANLNNLMPLPGSAYYREFLDRGIVTHSETLWDEIGVLPESFENIRLYNDISSDRFVQLCEEAKSIIWDINIRNYIRVNWYRDPRYCLENAISLIGRFFAGKKGTATYLVAQRLYRSMKGTLKKVLKEVRNRWRREQG